MKVMEKNSPEKGKLEKGGGEGNSNPLQNSCLANPMDGGAWWAAVHGVARSQTQLSDFTFMHWRRKWQPTPVFLPGGKARWGEPGGLPFLGSHRVRHNWSDLAAAAEKGRLIRPLTKSPQVKSLSPWKTAARTETEASCVMCYLSDEQEPPADPPCVVTCFKRASRCSFSEAVAWWSQANISPTYLMGKLNVGENFLQKNTEYPNNVCCYTSKGHGSAFQWV